MKNSATTTGAANQSPALKKHIQRSQTPATQPVKKLQSSGSTSGAANQAPSVKKHLQS